MTAAEKSQQRLKQTWAAIAILGFMICGGFALAWFGKSLDGYSQMVSVVALAIGGVQGANFFSTPKDSA